MADQLAVPASDLAVGGWSNELGATTGLSASLDEAAAAVSDADHIVSGATPDQDTFLCALTAIGEPSAGIVQLVIRGKLGLIVMATSVRFIWAAVPIATSYVLQVGPSVGTWTTFDANVGNVTISPTMSLAAGTYYYQVIPYMSALPLETVGPYVVTITGSE